MSNNNNDILIACEGVSKKFCKDFKRSLWYGIKDVSLSFSDRGDHNSVLRKDEFWAVKDINFELRRGECLGLIGHNGAGKSTLLKILNGLLTPDVGQVTMRGRVGALIELGAGFNPILTGRENVYNNAAVLGFTKKEIDAKYDKIVEFSEIGEFIESPVQNYSSGMKVRLGFAIAAQMEPDILLIDEVLAVGDLGFVLKCFKTIDELLPRTAIVFVSHSMSMISRICSKVIYMDRGMEKFQGKNISKAVELYYNKFDNPEKVVVFDNGAVSLQNITINTQNRKNTNKLNWKDDITIIFECVNNNLDYLPHLSIFVYDKEQRSAGSFTYEYDPKPLEKGHFVVKIKHNNIQWSRGFYNISIVFYKDFEKSPIYRANMVKSFQVIHDIDSWSPLLLEATIEE